MVWLIIGSITALIITIITLLSAIRIVRPTERGVIERLGKYNRIANPGLNLIIPYLERIIYVDITEQMVDANKQEIITQDNLNASVDAQVYYKVKSDEISLKACLYNVNNYEKQIVSLARTTLRNIIGTLTLRVANSDRNKINKELMADLKEETINWGIDVVRTELKEIDPPEDVQETMNKVVKAENERIAAKDLATAREVQADGERRARIKVAEGKKQARILEAEGIKESKKSIAEGQAEAIKLVNESAEKHFKGNAQKLKQLEVYEVAFKDNTKFVVPSDQSVVNVIGSAGGVLPVDMKKTLKEAST